MEATMQPGQMPAQPDGKSKPQEPKCTGFGWGLFLAGALIGGAVLTLAGIAISMHGGGETAEPEGGSPEPKPEPESEPGQSQEPSWSKVDARKPPEEEDVPSAANEVAQEKDAPPGIQPAADAGG